MTWMRRLALLGLALGLLLSVPALARVGGGDSFGGGDSGGDWGGDGGGGGDGSGELFAWLFYLAVRYPYVGVPLLGAAGVGWYLARGRKKGGPPASQDTLLMRARAGALARRRAVLKTQLEPLVKDDPNFSELLFLDFVHMIYTRFQEARGQPESEGLKPYLSEEILERLARVGRQVGPSGLKVEAVVVGALRVDGVGRVGDFWQLACELESNYTERSQERTQTYYSRTRLAFHRRAGVLSKAPDEIRALGCPGCGSPVKLDAENLCAYCGRAVEPGLFHWELHEVEELMRMRREEAPLPPGGEEVGTRLPTVFAEDLDLQQKAFLLRYPGESLTRLQARAREVFLELQAAWSAGEWERARAFETDRLFQAHLFWMDRYKARGLRNLLEDVQVQELTLVKLERDAFYELATLRIQARMRDYTVDASGRVVTGRKDPPRTFSEYWTFMRRAGFQPREGEDGGTHSCPACGAPIQVGMHGRCEHCDANLTAGQFDWTLALIEQDEAYGG
jgi:predicted lipid-binding transport protein (Tim44 family)